MPLEPKGITIIDNDTVVENKLEQLDKKTTDLQEHTYEIMCDFNEDLDDLDEKLSKIEDTTIDLSTSFGKADQRMAEIEERYSTLNYNFKQFQSNTHDNMSILFEERRKRLAVKEFFKIAFASIASFTIMAFAIYGVVQLIINLNK